MTVWCNRWPFDAKHLKSVVQSSPFKVMPYFFKTRFFSTEKLGRSNLSRVDGMPLVEIEAKLKKEPEATSRS